MFFESRIVSGSFLLSAHLGRYCIFHGSVCLIGDVVIYFLCKYHAASLKTFLMQHNHQYLPVALDSPTQHSPTQSNEALLYPSNYDTHRPSPEHRPIRQIYYDQFEKDQPSSSTQSPVSSREEDATSVMVMTKGGPLARGCALWLCRAANKQPSLRGVCGPFFAMHGAQDRHGVV